MNNCLPIKKNIFKEGTLLGVIQPHSAKQIKTPNWQIFARGVFPKVPEKKKTSQLSGPLQTSKTRSQNLVVMSYPHYYSLDV